jgi:hypothetical protein
MGKNPTLLSQLASHLPSKPGTRLILDEFEEFLGETQGWDHRAKRKVKLATGSRVSDLHRFADPYLKAVTSQTEEVETKSDAMKTKVPKDLKTSKPGKLADMLYQLREERKVIEAQAQLVKDEETRIADYLLNSMDKDELSKLTGSIAAVSIKRDPTPNIIDWDAFYAYVVKEKAFGLLQRRASIGAFQERWNAGIIVPGVEKFIKIGLSVRKAS